MKCEFCDHEVPNGTTECPYCHKIFQIDAQVLSPDERDTFEGVTIEEDGSTSENESVRREERAEEVREEYSQGYGQQQMPRGFTVQTTGCGTSMFMTVLILCAIIALFFFLLPAFLTFALIGAAVVFVLRLVGGLFM